MSVVDGLKAVVSGIGVSILQAPDLIVAMIEVLLGDPLFVVAALGILERFVDRLPVLSAPFVSDLLTAALAVAVVVYGIRFARRVNSNL